MSDPLLSGGGAELTDQGLLLFRGQIASVDPIGPHTDFRLFRRRRLFRLLRGGQSRLFAG